MCDTRHTSSRHPASLALLLLLAPAPAALRLSQQRGAESGGSEICSPEPRERIEGELPPGPGYLGPGVSFLQDTAADASHVESAMREYQTNLSFVRYCSSIKDVTSALAPLVVPSLKLAFCYVPKVACTQFKDLINSLNELGLPEGFGKNYLKSTPWNLHVNRADMSKANGWTFATFTRDPALRYLSAFGSTCVSKGPNDNYEHKFECCGPLVKSNTLPAETIISMFEQRVQYDLKNGVVKGDDHWVSQVQILRMCGWDRFKPEHLDFHGRMSGDMNSQVRAMLKMVDAKPWMLNRANQLFPPDSVAGHQSPLHHISPEMFYRNASTLQAIQKIFEDDYEKIPQVGCSFTDPNAARPAARSASARAAAAEPEQRKDAQKKEEGHKEGEQREDVQKKTEVSKEDEKQAEEARRKLEEEKRNRDPEELRKHAVEMQMKRAEEQKKKQEKAKRESQEFRIRKREEATQKKRWEEQKSKQEKAMRPAQAKWRKKHMEKISTAEE